MKRLILHIGAHRCGSTAIQNVLETRRDALGRAETGVTLRRDMENGIMDLRRLHRFSRFNPMQRMHLKKVAHQILSSPYQTIIVSEENLVGTMPGVLSPAFYPYFSNLMTGLMALQALLSNQCSLHIRFVVRRQDRFIESVYAFRVSRGLDIDFPTFLNRVNADEISWLGLLEATTALPSDMDVKFAVLEAWQQGDAVKEVESFLGLPSVEGEQASMRLRGNARFDPEKLHVLLAANRSGFDAHKAFGANHLLGLSPDMMIEAIEGQLSADKKNTFQKTLSKQHILGYAPEGRQALIARLRSRNTEFLSHQKVQAKTNVWDE